MPREAALMGVYMPSLTLIFLLTLTLGWGIDRCIAWTGLYQYAWHPILLRVSLFICFFSTAGLWVYR